MSHTRKQKRYKARLHHFGVLIHHLGLGDARSNRSALLLLALALPLILVLQRRRRLAESGGSFLAFLGFLFFFVFEGDPNERGKAPRGEAATLNSGSIGCGGRGALAIGSPDLSMPG